MDSRICIYSVLMSPKHKLSRGFLASPDGVKKLQAQRFDKKYTYETLAEKVDTSVTSVKNLFHPHWNRPIQRETIEKIVRALDLTPTDIIAANQWNSSPATNQPQEANMIVFQGELETQMTEDQVLATQLNSLMPPLDSAGVKRQEMLNSVEVTGNLEVGDLTQKTQRGSSAEQKMATNLKAENIKLGNLTQES